LSLNIFVLFSCYFSNSNYSESIRFLDLILTYFEENPTLNAVGPFQDKVNNIKIEIETYNVEKAHNIWTTLGAKYIPSAMYKIRMIVVDSNSISSFVPALRGIRSKGDVSS
jgi:hypothetical protein